MNHSQQDKYFILHLSLIDDIGPALIQKIFQTKRSDMKLSDLYSFSSQEWHNFFGLSEKIVEKITAGLSNKKMLENELMLIERYDINWTTLFDDNYPTLLREIHLPPIMLYWQGNSTFNDDARSLAVVGSRLSNAYGREVIEIVIPEMVHAGWTIVSGGALGIDTLAHDITLQAGGKTIVVLGSGLLQPYPFANKQLFAKIIEKGGLIVSSFPLNAEPLPCNFPARNRIISGLSRGCLVVQAAEKSGALITAYYALEQGRELFAVPGSINDPLSAGCHKLIQNGAKLVNSSADILSEFGLYVAPPTAQQEIFVPTQRRTKTIEFSEDLSLTENQKKIIQVCRKQSSLDDIAAATGLDMIAVQADLFDLQIAGKLQQDFSGLWKA